MQGIFAACQVVCTVVGKYRRIAVFVRDGSHISRLVEGVHFLPAFAVGFADVPAAPILLCLIFDNNDYPFICSFFFIWGDNNLQLFSEFWIKLSANL